MTVSLLSLASVLAVSLVALSGLLTLSLDEVRIRRLSTFFVSFAVGAPIPELQHDRSARALIVQTSLIILGIAVMALLALFE